MNILVTVKNEYMVRIKNLLVKLIFDGLNSIYAKTREVSGNDDVLKTFQSLLKRVPKWTDEILDNEVVRIRSVLDNNFDHLNNLIKAAIKSSYNIMAFGNEIDFDINSILGEFSFKEFIREVYIESSRDIYNNPFLFYHNYSPIDIKRNQREVLEIIGKSLEESIRKLLPIKLILDSFLNKTNKSFKVVYPNDVETKSLNENFIDEYVNDDLEKDIFNMKQIQLSPLQNPDQQNPDQQNPNLQPNLDPNLQPNLLNNNIVNPDIQDPVFSNDNFQNKSIQLGGNNDSSIKILNNGSLNNSENIHSNGEIVRSLSTDNNSVQEKIMDIINEKSLNLTNISEFENTNNSSLASQNKNNSNTEICNETFISKKSVEKVSSESQKGGSSVKKYSNGSSVDNKSAGSSNKNVQNSKSQSELDSKLEKLLKNDLGDSETDSTIAVENNSNYQEVFSNSNSSHDSSLNSQQREDELNKKKFFANYLNM